MPVELIQKTLKIARNPMLVSMDLGHKNSTRNRFADDNVLSLEKF